MMVTRIRGFSSVSSLASATGCQYRRSSSPPGVPAPTRVSSSFSSLVSITSPPELAAPSSPLELQRSRSTNLELQIEAVVAIGHRGHVALDAFLAVRLSEIATDFGILILVVDEHASFRTRAVDAILVATALGPQWHAPAIHGHVARGHLAGAHMLVEPAIRRHVDAVRS